MPPELREMWPTGISPVLQIFSADKDTKTVAESGHFVLYYASDSKLKFEGDDDADRVDYYSHFAEGSLQSYGVGIIVGEVTAGSIPWPLNVPLQSLKINAMLYAKRLFTNDQFADSQLEKKGGGFFVGDHMSGADIMLDYLVSSNLFKGKLQAECDSRKESEGCVSELVQVAPIDLEPATEIGSRGEEQGVRREKGASLNRKYFF